MSYPADTVSATHCPYCALQCGLHVQEAATGTWTVDSRDFPTNRGGLCQKGWTSAELLSHPDRLLMPLIRENGALRPGSWREALDKVAAATIRTQARYGLDAVGILGSGSLTNEKTYLLGKFARVALKTSQIDYNGRFCMSSGAAAGNKAFGIDRGLPFPLADIAGAGTILLIGSNPAETMPPIMQYFVQQQANGGSLITVDPRLTATGVQATLHLQITPGADAALANGLLHILLKEGYADEAFIAARTTGFDEVRRIAATYWPGRVERLTGIPESQLHHAAELLGKAKSVMVLTARGPEQQSHGVDNVLAFINLALALGQVGKPNSGFGTLTGQGNGQGGREHGQKADQLPGYRRLDNPADRAHMAQIWGIDEKDLPQPGRSAYELLDNMGNDGGVRTLLVFGTNPAVSAPRAGHVQERLKALDFLVVSDFFLSETAALADVVLPSAQWAEESGTMTNLEGRVILRQRAKPLPDGVRTDTQILEGLAERLGFAKGFPSEPAEIFAEFRRATAGGTADYAGITYERIMKEDGVFWPCPSEDHPGTPRLFADRFHTPDGRARFHAIEFKGPAEPPDDAYPHYLITGRLMSQYQSGNQTRRVTQLAEATPESFVQLHPAMAKTYGIVEGDAVRLTTRRGVADVVARLTTSIRMDTLFVPFHYNGVGCANLLTNPALDPISKMPEFKVCAVKLEKGPVA